MKAVAKDRKAIVLFAIVSMLYWMPQMGVSPYLSPYMSMLGAASSITGLMIGAFGLPQLLLRLPLGIVTDRTSQYKLYIIIGNGVGMVSLLGMWMFTDPWLLVLMRMLSGITASTWVCYTVMYAGYFDKAGNIKPVQHVTAYLYAGQTIGYALSLLAVLLWDIRTMFLVMFVISAICFVFSFFIKENGVKVDRPPVSWGQVRSLLKNKYLWLVTLIGFFQQFLTFAISQGFLPLYTPTIGVSESLYTIMTVASTLSACLGSVFLVKPMLRKIGKKGSLIVCTILCVAFCIAVPLCTSAAAMVCAKIIFGFVHGTMFTITIGLSIRGIPYEKQAASTGFFYSLSGGGILVGPVVCGAIAEVVPLKTAFIIIGLICIISVILAIVLPKDETIAVQEQELQKEAS